MEYKSNYSCTSAYTPSLEYRVAFYDISHKYERLIPVAYCSGSIYGIPAGKKGPYES